MNIFITIIETILICFIFLCAQLAIVFCYAKFYDIDLKERENFSAMFSCVAGGVVLALAVRLIF